MISFFGINFRFHPLFIMIMLASILTGYFIELITLFGIVFIHELGHIVAARALRWRIREVQLLPFGGVMITDEQGTVSARDETIVALAGPLQNALMIALSFAMQRWGLWQPSWSNYVIQANMLIGCFNLLPILPLDGGKVMQSLFSLFLNYYRTIAYCTWLSIVMSALLIIASIVHFQTTGIQLNLLMIGLFLFYSNIYQLRHLQYHYIRFLMNREIRSSLMIEKGVLARPIVVRKSQYIRDIIFMLMREHYHLIYIINEFGTIQAVVPEQQIIRTFLREKKPGSAVSDLFMVE